MRALLALIALLILAVILWLGVLKPSIEIRGLGCRRLPARRASRRRQHGARRCRPADHGPGGCVRWGKSRPGPERERRPWQLGCACLGGARRPVHPGPRQPGRRSPRAGLDAGRPDRDAVRHRTWCSRTRTAAKGRSCSSGTARRSSSCDSRTSATSISTSSRRSSFRPATNSACPSRARGRRPMRPRRPVLRIPAPIGRARRARPSALAAALGLVVALGTPVAGAPPDLRAARGASPQAGRPEVDTPFQPTRPAAPASLAPPPGSTSLVSVDTDGGFGSGPSGGPVEQFAGGPSISANGRYVAFPSMAEDLVAGDTNGTMDIFVRDRRGRGATIRLPVPGGAPPIGGRAFQPVDLGGRYGCRVRLSRSADLRDRCPALPRAPGHRPVETRDERQRGRVVLSERRDRVHQYGAVGVSRRPLRRLHLHGTGRHGRSNRFVFVRDTVANSTALASADTPDGDRRWQQFRPGHLARRSRCRLHIGRRRPRRRRPERATGRVRPRPDDGPDGARQHRRRRPGRSA